MDNISGILSRQRRAVEFYIKAKQAVIVEGFAAEIDWQNQLRFSRITESDFLREAAWVVLSSGMREVVIRKIFQPISAVFYAWESATQIVNDSQKCRTLALSLFAHQQKIDAIITIAQIISSQGFENFKKCIQHDGVRFIQSLPFMGPATSCHLAKNLGLDIVKPDRHLLRLAAAAGYESPKRLCEDISASVGDRLSVVDLVMWRFATLNPNYSDYFS
jgi:hypothetical protein